jgi:hypothetical protein
MVLWILTLGPPVLPAALTVLQPLRDSQRCFLLVSLLRPAPSQLFAYCGLLHAIWNVVRNPPCTEYITYCLGL